MSKHTPGPWTFDEEPDGQKFTTIEHEGMPICEVRGTDDMSCLEDEEWKEAEEMCLANARLIAAAPDMLVMLKRIYEAPILPMNVSADEMKLLTVDLPALIQKAEPEN